ncbi:MAG: carboxymuconolactone decarboxylase family protein [Haloechinothrix sp.]
MSVRERPFLRQVQHIRPNLGDPRTTAVRAQIVRDFGVLVPPFALHLPAPELLAAYWAMTREPTWASRVARARKEAVAAAVSTTNQCPYCVDVHTTMLHTLGDRAPAAAIAAGDPDTIADAGMRALIAWARASRTPDAPILRERPFPDEHAPELVGIAVAYLHQPHGQHLRGRIAVSDSHRADPALPATASRPSLPQAAGATGRTGRVARPAPPGTAATRSWLGHGRPDHRRRLRPSRRGLRDRRPAGTPGAGTDAGDGPTGHMAR